MITINAVSTWILTMVILNPMQLTSVRADPLFSTGTDPATKVENCGESMMTTIPQKKRKAKTKEGAKRKMTGEIKQQIPEAHNAMKATLKLPSDFAM